MRASPTFAFGAAAVLAASIFASLAPARADPAYSSENVVQIFLKQKDALKGGKTRALCVGTAADCKKQEGAEAPPPVQFDLLANFEFNSDKLTQAARENLDQFAKAIKDPRLAGSKFEIDGHTDAVGPEREKYRATRSAGTGGASSAGVAGRRHQEWRQRPGICRRQRPHHRPMEARPHVCGRRRRQA